jgi:hypothetical protein
MNVLTNSPRAGIYIIPNLHVEVVAMAVVLSQNNY